MSKKTLLLIDVQRNMLLPPQPVPDAPAVGPRIAGILDQARRDGAMVIHVRNNGGEDDPDAPGTTGWELIHDVAGHEAVVDKRTPNGFAGTELGNLLVDASEVVIVGMQSEYCVRETSSGTGPGCAATRCFWSSSPGCCPSPPSPCSSW
jgi:nicotinamidase-related amidase